MLLLLIGSGGRIFKVTDDFAELVDVVGLDSALSFIAELGELFLLLGWKLIAFFGQGLVDLVDIGLSLVLDFDVILALLVGFLVLFSFADHAVDVFLGKTVGAGDGDVLRLLGIEVFSGDFDDAVDVDGEGNFDTWLTTASRFDAGKLEVAEQFVVVSHWTFALVDHDVDGWLVVFSGREDLALGGWNRGVAWDERSHDATEGFNTKG